MKVTRRIEESKINHLLMSAQKSIKNFLLSFWYFTEHIKSKVLPHHLDSLSKRSEVPIDAHYAEINDDFSILLPKPVEQE